MDIMLENTLRYFKKTIELGSLRTVEFSKAGGSFWRVPYQEIESGQLKQERTDELFETYFKANNADEKKRSETKQIPIIVSLRALSNGRTAFGVLNIACLLLKSGKLVADQDGQGPWIPQDRLITDNSEMLDIMIGELADFWRFKKKEAEEQESRIESWGDNLRYAERLYTSVSAKLTVNTRDSVEAFIEGVAFLKLGDNMNPGAAIVELYESLIRLDDLPPTLTELLVPTKSKRPDSYISQRDRTRASMRSFCGSMGREFPLADSQRTAVHAFTSMNDGEVLAVSGPPGTGKTTMLQAIVADLITRHALQGDPAPLIVGFSANNQAVTNIIDSFSSVVSKQHSMLDFRWLLEAGELQQTQNDHPDEQKTLPGIAVYCPSRSRLAKARKSYLVEQVDKSGLYTEYSEKSYIHRAKRAFLDFSRQLFGSATPGEVSGVQQHILKLLFQLDQTRRRFVEAAARHLEQREVHGAVENLNEVIAASTGEIAHARDRLAYWNRIDEERPLKGIFRKRPATSDEDLIYANKTDADTFLSSIDTITSVKTHYKTAIHEQEKKRADAKQTASEYEQIGQRVHRAFSDLQQQLCSLLPERQTSDRLAAFERGEIKTLTELDRMIDVTARYVEFWLAVHYYECQWLIDCSSTANLIAEKKRFMSTRDMQDRYWMQIASLTPCFVMTEYQLPKYFALYDGKGRPKKPDIGRIDLLIVDEAGQVNTPEAAAAFALAKKAVVVGDVHQLSPVWSFTPEADQSIAKDCLLKTEHWDERAEHGLAASEPSSLMRAAVQACVWCYSETEGGLFLREHYRCVEGIISVSNNLMYEGRLIPARTKPSKLENRVDPFIFHIVDGSADEKAGASRRNRIEAEEIVNWIRANKQRINDIYQQPCEKCVGVVTPFAAQAKTIRSLLSESDAKLARSMAIGTAHTLQGAERPIVLFSVVYGDSRGEAGFIERTPELINVAISRAKDLFILFGSRKRLTDSGKVFTLIQRAASQGDGMLPDEPIEGEIDGAGDRGFTSSRKWSLAAPGPAHADARSYRRICSSAKCFRRDGSDFPAVLQICTFEGEKSISEVLKIWKTHPSAQGRSLPSAKDANQILRQTGLIEQSGDPAHQGWRPTVEGKRMGISEIPPGDRADYFMCKYNAVAADRILQVIEDEYACRSK